MPTLEQLEQGLLKAYDAGNMEYARTLGLAIVEARKEPANLIPGHTIDFLEEPAEETTIGEDLVGAGEAGLSVLTGATGGAIGHIGGTLKGLAEQILSGEFGTPEAAKLVEQSAIEGARALTYEPRTEAGREQVEAVGEALSVVPPVIPAVGPIGGVVSGVKQAAPLVAPALGAAAPVIGAAGKTLKGVVSKAPEEVVTSRETRPVSVGGVPAEIERRTVSEIMPVPFEGGSALTKGQASRNFSQLQFEKETAKLSDIGAPLRERVENQTATMIQNFDALVDKAGPINIEQRDIGKAITQAVINKANVAKKKISKAYKLAEESGDMEAIISTESLATRIGELERFEGVANNVTPIKREAIRLGAISEADGRLIGGEISIKDSELLRQFVNEATDWNNNRESLMAKRITSVIDDSTEGKGGELYKKARKLRANFAGEFENTGLTAKLLGTKRGTSERSIAFEDVFNKVILLSPVDEMNKLRGTLISAGPDGKQAWMDMKAAGIEHIKKYSLSPSQSDSAGNPLLSPDKLNKIVGNLDKTGKLESLYGKRQAQIIRDLADLSSVIYTAPPGAINYSNTASALQVALDSLGTFALTGLPAPVITTLREATKQVKNRKLKARVKSALSDFEKAGKSQ